MSSFFISPFRPPEWTGETDLRISPESYAQELKKLWIDVTTIVNQPIHEYLLWWELNRDNAFQIMGGLQENRNTVSVEGNKQFIAEFTVWHRAFVPHRYRLYFFHESLTSVYELHSQVTFREVLELLR